MGMMLLREPNGSRTKLILNEDGTTTVDWKWRKEDSRLLLSRGDEVLELEEVGKSYRSKVNKKVVLAPITNMERVGRTSRNSSIRSNVGDILARRFESIGIKAIQGCPCKNLQNRLNSMSPESILSDIKGWAQRLRLSARKWQELKGGIWNYIPTPPLWLCQRVLEDAIKEAQGRKDAGELTLIEE